MASKPFISARIPDDLNHQLEVRADAEGKSKTDILIGALAEYLDADGSNKSKTTNQSVRDLERNFGYFQRWVIDKVTKIEDKVYSLEDAQHSQLVSIEKSQKLLKSELEQVQEVTQKFPKRLMSGSPIYTT